MDNASPQGITKQIYISHHEEDAKIAKEIQNIIRQWGYADVYLDDVYTSESYFIGSQVIIALLSPASIGNERLRITWEQPNEDRKETFSHYLRGIFFIRLGTIEHSEKFTEVTEYDNASDMAILRNKLRLYFDMRRDTLSIGSIAHDIRKDIQIIANKIQHVTIPNHRPIIGESIQPGDEAILVRRIYDYWLQGILSPALDEAVVFGNAIQPDIAVKSQEYGNFAETIPQNELDFIKMFKQLSSFVVLGEPGSGKTIFFLQLATQLLRLYVENGSVKNNTYKLPLILNLSSWGRSEPAYDNFSLEEWILHEAERIYRIDRRKFAEWMQKERFIFFLDGLDEIHQDNRPQRIKKINEFKKQTGQNSGNITSNIKMVICCREQEYSRLNKQDKLIFTDEVKIQDLRQEQVEYYLKRDVTFLFRDLYYTNVHVRSLIKIPFLFIMMKKVSDGGQFGDSYAHFNDYNDEGWKRYLTNGYVTQQLQDSPYYVPRVKETLEWLGHKMQIYGVVFRIDLINIGWFDKKRYHYIHRFLLYALLFLLPIGSALAFANAVAGIMGAVILGLLILIFTIIIYRNFFFNQQYYYDFSYKKLFERLFSHTQPPEMHTNGHVLIVAGMVITAVLIWGIPQLIIVFDNTVFTFLIISMIWALGMALAAYWLLTYLKKPNPVRLLLVTIVPLTLLMTSALYFFNQAFSQFPAFQVIAGTAIPVLITGMIGTVQGDKTPPLLLRRKSLITIIIALALAIGLSFWAILPHSSFFAVTLTLALAFLILGGLRFLQIRLFYLFIYIRFRLHYHQIMKYLVTKDILRNFAGGFTFRHDYFFQRYIVKGIESQTLEEKARNLLDKLFEYTKANHVVDMNTPLIQDLIALGPVITPQLVRKMVDVSDDGLLKAIALVLKQPSMRANIIDQLGNKDDKTLYYFVDILAEIGDHTALDPMINKINYEYNLVRIRVAQFLGRIDNDQAVETLKAQFDIEQDKNVKQEIANLLCNSKRKKSEIRQLLQDAGFDCK